MSDFKCEVVKLGPLTKHPNADSLSLVMVWDYPCICRTEDWKEGDLAVYVPVDAVVPFTPEFDFIHGGADDTKHRRVKAKRLRGLFSMGFIHPVSTLDNGDIERNYLYKHDETGQFNICKYINVGDDVAEFLDITKYEPPPPKSYGKGGNLGGGQQAPEVPGFPKYTNIENIRRYNYILEPGELVVATEKIHGANFRCGWINGEFHVGSHSCLRRDPAEGFSCKRCLGAGNLDVLYMSEWETCPRCDGEGRIKDFHDSGAGMNIWWRAVEQYNLKEKLSVMPNHLLYAEVYGDVQDLTYGCKKGEIKLAAFDVYRTAGDADNAAILESFKGNGEIQFGYRDFYAMQAFCADLDIPTAPVLFNGFFDMDVIKEVSTGTETISGQGLHMREGVVVRPVKEREVHHFGRAILKVINSDYLLRKGGTEGQ